MSNNPSTILFAGGGTGGHIFPSLAIAERLAEKKAKSRPHFLVSTRPLDAQVLTKANMTFTPLPAQPMSVKPWDWPGFYRGWTTSIAIVRRLIDEMHATAVVTMGGFVSAPAVAAAKAAKIPVLLVNLDAVPGRANRLMAKRADEIFTVYPFAQWHQAQAIGLPLRRSALAPGNGLPGAARKELGLDPERETLLVTGASQGAQSINRLMIELVAHAQPRKALRAWQVLHLSGNSDVEDVKRAYQEAEVPARVETFCNAMGLAWGAASIAISRCGAGSVAEVWANAVPTIFLPYPYHKDQHQRLNAAPLAENGAATIFTDLIDPEANARQLMGPLLSLMSNGQQRDRMAETMRKHMPTDGAEVIAQWLFRAAG